MSGDSGQAQVEYDKIWMDAVLSELKQCLYAISGDMKSDRYWSLADNQHDYKFVSDIVFHKQNINGMHILPRLLECGGAACVSEPQ